MPITSSPKDNGVLRREMVKYLASFGFQNRHTPFGLAHDMVARIPDVSDKTILVLFNLEFLEELQEAGADMKAKVRFLADTPQEERFAKLVYGVDSVVADEATWKAALDDNNLLWGKYMGHKLNSAADITLSNPPYNGGIDLKIIMALHEAKLLKRLICVHPSTWLVDVKSQLIQNADKSLFQEFQGATAQHVTRAELFNGNTVFGIGLFVPCVITEMDMTSTRQGNILVKDVGQEDYREVTCLEDITLHGKDWDPTVRDFMGRVQKLCARVGNLDSNKNQVNPARSAQFPVQLAAITGNWTASSALKMVKDDFYTFVQKNPQANCGIRNNSQSVPTFYFGTAIEQQNLLTFLQTDFARMCLALVKLNQNLTRADRPNGNTVLVPWLDFKCTWDDNQLFDLLKYPRGHAIREYAKTFLPDYHNIYPHGKTY